MSNHPFDLRGRIVVGVDGSKPSIAALQWAAEVAEATGSVIDVVIAWDLPASYGVAALPSGWDPQTDATTVMKQSIEEAFGDLPPAGLSSTAIQGHPAHVLVEHSHDARMLVVGSRGHGGFIGLLIGSVSAYCAEHATCPVVVFHQ